MRDRFLSIGLSRAEKDSYSVSSVITYKYRKMSSRLEAAPYFVRVIFDGIGFVDSEFLGV